MRTKWIVVVSFLTLLLVSGPANAQGNTDPQLWGIWKQISIDGSSTAGDGFDTLQTFTPNGAWGVQYIEGITYGQWSAQNNVVTINGTTEYVEKVNWSESYSYEFISGHLVIHNFVGDGVVEEYVRIETFTGFGFIHCPASVKSNMFVGAYGHVTYTDGTASRLRQGPSISSTIVDQLPEGSFFLTVGEPECADGYTWWPINTNPYNPGSGHDNSTLSGWIAEGEDGVAYIEPIGWIDTSLLQVAPRTEAEVMNDLANETGGTVYAPGTYPFRQQAAEALASQGIGTSTDLYADIIDFVDTAIIVVKTQEGVNPVEIACMFISADDFWNQDFFDKGNVVGCAVMDAGSHVASFGVAGAAFYVAKLLLTPSELIDPILVDPVNRWADSRPLTRFVCWVKPDFCP